MTKVISITKEMHVLRTQSALLKLRTICAQRSLYAGTKVYRLAVARRYTVCYFAFLNYLMSCLSLDQEPESIGMEDILHRCRRHNLFSAHDERMVIQMSMLYAAFSYYNEGFDGTSDELLHDIPRMCDFLEKFIGFQTVMPVSRSYLEAVI